MLLLTLFCMCLLGAHASAQFDSSLTVDINNLPSAEEIHRRLKRQGKLTLILFAYIAV